MTATYTFGTFRLDTARRLLLNGDDSTPLPERAFQLLLLLIEAAGEVVSKETLASKVWPEAVVSDANLSQHIYLLRRMLREKASDRSFIMTVSGRGFRFAAPIGTPTNGPTSDAIEVAPLAAAPLPRIGRSTDPLWEYCRGSQLLERRTAPELWSAIEAFENAIRLNDSSAPSYVGLARAHSLLGELGFAPAVTAFSKARTAIGHAINIDPSSAPAYAVFSETLLLGDWDWNGARGASDHALRLSPGSTFVRRNAVRLSMALGDCAKAGSDAQLALMLDPSNVALQVLFAQAMTYAREYDQAIPVLSNLLELEPGCDIARRHRAQAFLLDGRPELAIGDLAQLSTDSGANSHDVALMARAFAACGDDERAREAHRRLLELRSSHCVLGVTLALSAAGLGYATEAIAHLQNAYRDREPALVFLKCLHWFDSLRESRDFTQLLTDIGPAVRRSTHASVGFDNFEELRA